MKKAITREQVEKYNAMVEAAIGTNAYDMLALYREYRDDDTKRWGGNPYHYLYPIGTYDWWSDLNNVTFYIKSIGDMFYLYIDLDGEPADRYRLVDKEIARAFFGIKEDK